MLHHMHQKVYRMHQIVYRTYQMIYRMYQIVYRTHQMVYRMIYGRASENCDCVIHSCNNNFFLLIQFVAIDILVLVL